MSVGRKEKEFRVLRALIRPAIRFCLKRSLRVQELYSALKEEFLELAEEELILSGETPSSSRLSVATGLQRKEILRLQSVGSGPVSRDQNTLTRIVGRWSESTEFSIKGKPRRLSFKGAESEFADLVKGVNSDLSHHTILNEMERLSLIKRSGNLVVLLRESVQLTGDNGYKVIATDMDDLFKAGSNNIASRIEPRHLHAKTSFDNVPAEALPKINKWIFELGEQIHKKVRERLSKFDRDSNPSVKAKGARSRVTFTTFSFDEETSGSGSDVDQ